MQSVTLHNDRRDRLLCVWMFPFQTSFYYHHHHLHHDDSQEQFCAVTQWSEAKRGTTRTGQRMKTSGMTVKEKTKSNEDSCTDKKRLQTEKIEPVIITKSSKTRGETAVLTESDHDGIDVHVYIKFPLVWIHSRTTSKRIVFSVGGNRCIVTSHVKLTKKTKKR